MSVVEEAKMGKLHEVLAVENEVKGTADSILAETRTTFSKKPDHFLGQNRHYNPVNDDGEKFNDENKEMVTTVRDKLDHTEDYVGRLLDIIYQKEEANTRAKADLVVNGIVLHKEVPATVLLSFETKLRGLREVYREIPTLEPGEQWKPDNDRANTFISTVQSTYRTQKVLKAIVLYPHTDKHPAQVEKNMVDERVGTWLTTRWSGQMRPIDKSQLLERLDVLIAAVKKARCRANEVEAGNATIAKKLFQFINTGTVGVES
jgi:hypothetical protein